MACRTGRPIKKSAITPIDGAVVVYCMAYKTHYTVVVLTSVWISPQGETETEYNRALHRKQAWTVEIGNNLPIVGGSNHLDPTIPCLPQCKSLHHLQWGGASIERWSHMGVVASSISIDWWKLSSTSTWLFSLAPLKLMEQHSTSYACYSIQVISLCSEEDRWSKHPFLISVGVPTVRTTPISNLTLILLIGYKLILGTTPLNG